MKIFFDTDNFIPLSNAVVTIGTFDGVHLGHKKVLEETEKLAGSVGGNAVVITFSNHPRIVLKKEHENLKVLNTLPEKQLMLETAGVKNLLMLPFDEDLARLPASDFIKKYVVDIIGAKNIVVGYDHHIGKGRQAGFNEIESAAVKHGVEVVLVGPALYNGSPISSTRIRKLLIEGDVTMANECLGYEYFFSGKIVSGEQIGNKLGFPTANIRPEDPFKLIPARGVYAVSVKLKGNKYYGMMNIGVKPTLDDKRKSNEPLMNKRLSEEVIEVNIFDFDDYIYNENISVNVIARIRDEIKFDNLDSLKKQIELDKQKIINILSV